MAKAMGARSLHKHCADHALVMQALIKFQVWLESHEGSSELAQVDATSLLRLTILGTFPLLSQHLNAFALAAKLH